MARPVVVRIKGKKWEAAVSSETPESSSMAPGETGKAEGLADGESKAIMLDLAVRHFRSLHLTRIEAKRLGMALRRCLKGEPVDVGPLRASGRIYSFRRRANAIAIRAGQGCIRLPLDAARALILPLRGAVSPCIPAKAG